MSFTRLFGGSAIAPSQPSYAALTIASDTQLVWPLETTAGSPVVATMLDVTAFFGGLNLLMPSALQGSTGVQTMVTNKGSNSFTITDTNGNAIATLAPTQAWLIALTDNTTEDGTWTALQMASTTSSASAAALAGAGLIAIGSRLSPNSIANEYTTNHTLVAADRLRISLWLGVVDGIFQLDTIANLTPGWLTFIKNQTTLHNLRVQTSGGETIDGMGFIDLGPGDGITVVCAASGFYSLPSVAIPVPVHSGGTGAENAPDALTNLGGTAVGQSIFTAPNAASVRAILGITSVGPFNEVTVSTNQALNSGSTGSAYVCTAALNATLPLSTDLATDFMVAFFAQTGALTITPQAADKINGGTLGAAVVIPAGGSIMLLTDANGNWWPFFTARGDGVFATLSVTGSATIGVDLHVQGSETIVGNLQVSGDETVVGTLHAAHLSISGGASILGGLHADTLVGGVLSVSGGATITGASTVVGALSAMTNATVGNQVPNLTQFPSLVGNPMSAAFPGGVIKGGSTVTGVGGLVTINFGTAFPTACETAVAVLNAANPTGGWSIDTTGALLPGSVTFVGTIAGVGTAGMGFNWVAIGD